MTASTLTLDRVSLRACSVRVDADALTLELVDGRVISAPLAWYPRLLAGTAVERANSEMIGDGEGVHWPDLDEDLSIESVLAGRPSVESADSFRRWMAVRTPPATACSHP